MIRINLYQTAPKPKRGKRAAAPVVPGSEGAGLLVLIFLVATVTVAANGAWYWKIKHDAERIQSDMKKADLEYARLTLVKQRYQERERQKESYKKRVDVIDQLRASQFGPMRLLGMLGETVNRTDAVWLETMTDDGTNINLKGYALSVHGVADLMRNLQNTGYFNDVDIKSAFQDASVREMQAFIFELYCRKQAAQPQSSQPAQPPKKS